MELLKINTEFLFKLYDEHTGKVLDHRLKYVITDNNYNIIEETTNIFSMNLKNKHVFLRCDFTTDKILLNAEYAFFPTLLNEQDKHRFAKYVGCNCGDDKIIHIHTVVNGVAQATKLIPIIGWRLWRKISITTKI
jgi:hypothetical protein